MHIRTLLFFGISFLPIISHSWVSDFPISTHIASNNNGGYKIIIQLKEGRGPLQFDQIELSKLFYIDDNTLDGKNFRNNALCDCMQQCNITKSLTEIEPLISIEWDGKDDKCRPAGPGLYSIVITYPYIEDEESRIQHLLKQIEIK